MTKRNNIFGIILLLAAGLLAGCRFADEPERRYEIAVSTGVTGLQKRVASVNNASDLQSHDLKIDAYFHDTEVKYLDGKKLHYDASEWKFWSNDEPGSQLHYYWPIEGSVYTPGVGDPITVSSLDFVGFCPYTRPDYITADPTYNHSTGISFSCDLGEYMTNAAQATVTEFMLDTVNTRTVAGGAVPLNFKHPFAIIKFVITSASGEHVKVDSIGISGLKTTGSCVFNGSGFTWSSQAGSGDMSLDGLNLKYGTGTTETAPFLVIPNNYGSKHITVKATWDDWSDVTVRDYGADVTINWEAGHVYTYNLTLSKYGLIVDAEKYTEQW